MAHTTGHVTFLNQRENACGFAPTRFLVSFGELGYTRCIVWADGIDDALDEAADWVVENYPGLLCDEPLGEAEIDVVRLGNNACCFSSDEICVTENPSRELVRRLIERL